MSVKWADRNVGAEKPWDNGAYFSWSNVEGVVYEITKKSEDDLIITLLGDEATPEQIEEAKNDPDVMNVINQIIRGEFTLITGTTFGWETTPYYSGSTYDDEGNKRYLFSKYNGTDGLTVLEAIDDAATANMGDGWRMPTSAETRELVQGTDQYYIDLSGNTVSKSELDGSIKLRSICFVQKGATFDYNVRDNFIEIPFAGQCYDSILINDGVSGNVWSSSVYYNDFPGGAYYLYFYNGSLGSYADIGRFFGLSVRGVRV